VDVVSLATTPHLDRLAASGGERVLRGSDRPMLRVGEI